MIFDNSRFRKVFTGALVGASVVWGSDQLLRRRFRGRNYADELHHTITRDGVEIGLWRYRPDDLPSKPIIAVHGLGVNHLHMDLDQHFSIAQYLRDCGYDVWCVVLRGRGISEVPDQWNFDDYAQHDLPAAIDHVLDKTGYAKLHWIGHSMGGMLYYALAGAVDYGHKIASAVSIGGPFFGRRNDDQPADSRESSTESELSGYAHLLAPVVEIMRGLRLPWPVTARWGAIAYSRIKNLLPQKLIHIMINPDNIDNFTLLKAAVRDVEPVSVGVLAQFIDWGMNRYWSDQSGELNYRKAVSDITVPTRLVAGRADNMVPVHNQQNGYDQLASQKKDLIIAGQDKGFSRNYSHVDLVYGQRAREEIFPLITDWFNQFSLKNNGSTLMSN